MIGSLRGTLLDRSLDGELLVEVQGIGYRVTVSPSTALAIGDVDAEVFVHTHHHLREDAQTLYGFATREERLCFEALLSAHGVGPALALAILSVHDPSALRQILLDEDVAALCLVPGVGKKTAARLLVELTSKLDLPELERAPSTAPSSSSSLGDVRVALSELGYGPDEIRDALADLPDHETGDAGSLLREALQRLAVGR